jgi:1-pyrroline-5-carboxylate dehydrogenase
MYRVFASRALRAKSLCDKSSTSLASLTLSRLNHSIPFATVDAEELSGAHPAEVQSFVQGKWIGSSNHNTLLDPLNGEPFIKVAEVDESGTQPFVDSLSQCPKHGLHNPFKSPERYDLVEVWCYFFLFCHFPFCFIYEG